MLKYMQGTMQKPIEKPTYPCWSCGNTDYYQHSPETYWICNNCHPKVGVNKIVDEKK